MGKVKIPLSGDFFFVNIFFHSCIARIKSARQQNVRTFNIFMLDVISSSRVLAAKQSFYAHYMPTYKCMCVQFLLVSCAPSSFHNFSCDDVHYSMLRFFSSFCPYFDNFLPRICILTFMQVIAVVYVT